VTRAALTTWWDNAEKVHAHDSSGGRGVFYGEQLFNDEEDVAIWPDVLPWEPWESGYWQQSEPSGEWWSAELSEDETFDADEEAFCDDEGTQAAPEAAEVGGRTTPQQRDPDEQVRDAEALVVGTKRSLAEARPAMSALAIDKNSPLSMFLKV